MQLHFWTLLAMLFACAFAVNTQKPVIITFPDDTPQTVIDQAMDTLRRAGGIVTHEYNLFKGFAAKATDSSIEAIKALGQEFVPIIENDVVVSINGAVA